MARVDITEAEVMEIVIDHLRTTLELNERECYETVSPLTPPLTPLSEWWLSVSPGEGNYDEAMQSGGGRNQVTEEWQLLVTGYTRIRLDSTDRDMQLLREANRGLLQIKRRILDTMAQVDLRKPFPNTSIAGWDDMTTAEKIIAAREAARGRLANTLGDTFQRKYLVVRHAGKPEYDEKNQVGWQTVFFEMSHDWDLGCG